MAGAGMHVSYNSFSSGHKRIRRRNDACFSGAHRAYGPTQDNKGYLVIKIKVAPKIKELEGFWLELVKKIEPTVRYIKGCAVFKDISGYKLLFILSLLRYLWEDENYYHHIVPLTKKIIDDHPDIDPLKAVLIANSACPKISGFGHSLVCGMAGKLRTVQDYQKWNISGNVHEFTRSNFTGTAKREIINKEKKHKYDYEPMWKHFLKEGELDEFI